MEYYIASLFLVDSGIRTGAVRLPVTFGDDTVLSISAPKCSRYGKLALHYFLGAVIALSHHLHLKNTGSVFHPLYQPSTWLRPGLCRNFQWGSAHDACRGDGHGLRALWQHLPPTTIAIGTLVIILVLQIACCLPLLWVLRPCPAGVMGQTMV